MGRGEGYAGGTILRVGLSPEGVGARIVAARETKRWSQLDLALALGVSPSTIYRWEKGRLPSVADLMRLADILGLDVGELTESPQRRVELDDLHRSTEDVRLLLAEARDEAERGREALLVSLESIDARLSRIEQRLELPDARGSNRP